MRGRGTFDGEYRRGDCCGDGDGAGGGGGESLGEEGGAAPKACLLLRRTVPEPSDDSASCPRGVPEPSEGLPGVGGGGYLPGVPGGGGRKMARRAAGDPTATCRSPAAEVHSSAPPPETDDQLSSSRRSWRGCSGRGGEGEAEVEGGAVHSLPPTGCPSLAPSLCRLSVARAGVTAPLEGGNERERREPAMKAAAMSTAVLSRRRDRWSRSRLPRW